MRFVRETIFSAVDGTVPQTSDPIDSSYLFSASAQAVSAGGAVTGVVKFQGSNDPVPPPTQTSWSDIPSATIAVTAAGTFLVPKTELAYRWIRVVYTVAAGGGTLTVNFFGLGA